MEEVEVLLGDVFLQVADHRVQRQPQRPGGQPEHRHPELDHGPGHQLPGRGRVPVPDEPAQLADLGHRQVGQDRQPLVQARAVHSFHRIQWTVRRAQPAAPAAAGGCSSTA